ncbi:Serine/threonine-protein phosphatase 4 regulatory subunit 4, partial [Clydaea vesicula]
MSAPAIDWNSVLDDADDITDDAFLNGKNELNLSHRLHKTEEEIQKFSIDENFDEVERALYLIKNGSFIQKMSVIPTLEGLFRDHVQESKTKILPTFLELVLTESLEFQQYSSKVLLELLELGLLSPKTTQLLIPVAKKLLFTKENNGWADILIFTIKILPLDVLENYILPETTLESGLTQPASHRIYCCKVLGALASRLPSKRLPIIKKEIIPEYVELLQDEEDAVKEAAVESLFQILNILDQDIKINVVLFHYKKLLEDTNKILPICAKFLGFFLLNFKDNLSEFDLKFFINVFHNLSTSPMEGLRDMCAYNLPFYKILDLLSSDPLLDCRVRISCCLHEIAQILKEDSYHLLKGVFNKLLFDRELEVSQNIIKNLNLILNQFYFDEISRRTDQMNEVLFLILKKERDLASDYQYNWRIHEVFLSKFQLFTEYFDSEILFDHSVSLLIKLLSENTVLPIKLTLLKCLCIYLKKIKRIEHREQILRHLKEFKNAHGYQQRLHFLDICANILEHFSKKFFKILFFQDCLELAKDKIVNVKIRFLSLIPHLNETLNFPQDINLFSKLLETLKMLKEDEKNKQVRDKSTELLLKLERNNATEEGGSPAGSEFLKQNLFRWDAETIELRKEQDKKKEEEEKHFFVEWETSGSGLGGVGFRSLSNDKLLKLTNNESDVVSLRKVSSETDNLNTIISTTTNASATQTTKRNLNSNNNSNVSSGISNSNFNQFKKNLVNKNSNFAKRTPMNGSVIKQTSPKSSKDKLGDLVSPSRIASGGKNNSSPSSMRNRSVSDYAMKQNTNSLMSQLQRLDNCVSPNSLKKIGSGNMLGNNTTSSPSSPGFERKTRSPSIGSATTKTITKKGSNSGNLHSESSSTTVPSGSFLPASLKPTTLTGRPASPNNKVNVSSPKSASLARPKTNSSIKDVNKSTGMLDICGKKDSEKQISPSVGKDFQKFSQLPPLN